MPPHTVTDVDIIQIDDTIRTTLKRRCDASEQCYSLIIDSIMTTKWDSGCVYGGDPRYRRALDLCAAMIEVNKLDDNYGLYDMYVYETADTVIDYGNALSRPKMNIFEGKHADTDANVRRSALISRYVRSAVMYDSVITPHIQYRESAQSPACAVCRGGIDASSDDAYRVCTVCNIRTDTLSADTSFRDAGRINTIPSYKYNRITPFVECMRAFQARQNTAIPETVLAGVREHCRLNGLVTDSVTSPFGEVKIKHIFAILIEMKLPKHYANVNLIHSQITHTPPHDISHLEGDFTHDFAKLSALYTLRYAHLNRKHFLNMQYILYQFLCRYRYIVDMVDLVHMRSIKQFVFHDDICADLFAELGWRHFPLF
jgi:hypothetical protein